MEGEEGRGLECLPSTHLNPRSHKGPLKVASFSTHQTKERKEGVGVGDPRGGNLVAWPGGSWEFQRTEAGDRNSIAAHGDKGLFIWCHGAGPGVAGLLGHSPDPLPAPWAMGAPSSPSQPQFPFFA